MEHPLTDDEYKVLLLKQLGMIERDSTCLTIETLEAMVLDAGFELPLVRRQSLEHEGWGVVTAMQESLPAVGEALTGFFAEVEPAKEPQ